MTKTTQKPGRQIDLDKVREELPRLVSLRRDAAALADDYLDAVKFVSGKAGIKSSVLNKFVTAKAGEKFEDHKAYSEQLSLIFEEVV